MFILLTLLSLLSLPTFATPDINKLAHSPKWLKLLHYKKSFGSYVSQADGKGFFLHPDGKTNPVKELQQNIELFGLKKTPSDDDAICKFPLRYKWLNSELGFPWKADLSGCHKYIAFFSKLAAKKATVVFSSYYLSNPNTAFGHTLLRLSRYDEKGATEMLDYGINYSAHANATNPLTYAFKGLFGGYKGQFAAIPYYYKIREYSNSEFRDLWSYDLKVGMKEVLEMVDHIWELGNTDFDYYYFLENCSYHLLSIIEVALPDKNLTDNYSLFAIPADTVRLLKKEGLIEPGRRRESTFSKLIRLSEPLGVRDLQVAKAIATEPESTPKAIKGMDDTRAAQVLDVAMDAFDYYNADKMLGDDPKTKAQKNYILIARAKNPVITKDEDVSSLQSESPAESHSPTRFSLYQGYEDKFGKESRIELRAAHHDILDPPRGSLKAAQLEVGKVSFALKEHRYANPKLVLDNFSLFNIKNYPEQNFWSNPLSWEVDLGVRQLRRLSCFDCPGAYLLGSVGNSLQLGSAKKFLFSFLLNGELEGHNFYQENYRLGLGPKMYLRYVFSEKVLSGLTSYYHLNTYSGRRLMENHDLFVDWETRYHMKKDLSLALKIGNRDRQGVWSNQGEVGIQYFY